ncbi:Glu-tRNA(Gln) amidotransferase subunit GatE [Candidatus Woesearchaeota archaeon]|nr:Glu-tRNA(Gln) amidotransferase subunit GatE [Candidatus Woesearchaeota archaeon]
MTEKNLEEDLKYYNELGFKAGLEIHQQLETHKLFCKCPSLVNDPNKADIKFERRFRSVLSEKGEKDIVAEFEMQKNKVIRYEACSSSSCLVEYDEEPPHSINKYALNIALEIATLFNAEIVDEIQIMRKAVVDGSVTSGFQRTMLIAKRGYIKTSLGNVHIDTVCLEEEAAKKLSEDSNYITYRLDRLGVPLVEIATAPEIKTPEHAKECASIIGMILRSTNKVKRGIGTIRQDVNLSIRGHPRIEIKGFQELKSMPKVIENEVKRQIEDIKNKTLKAEVRKANVDFTTTFQRPMPGAARMYPETDHVPIKISEEMLENISRPELITEKTISLEKKYKISSVLAEEIIKNKINFEDYVSKLENIEPEFIARVLVEYPKQIKTKYNLEIKYDIYSILDLYNNRKISKEAVLEIMVELNATGRRLDEISKKYLSVDEEEVKKEIKKIILDLESEDKEPKMNEVMGRLMEKYRGKIDGKRAVELIKIILKS